MAAYTGEDELDYEDEDYTQRTSAHLAAEDVEEDEGFDDLYSDVNVGFFPNSSSATALPYVLKNSWEKVGGGTEAHGQVLGGENDFGEVQVPADGVPQMRTESNYYEQPNQIQPGVAAEPSVQSVKTTGCFTREDQQQGKATMPPSQASGEMQAADSGNTNRNGVVTGFLSAMDEIGNRDNVPGLHKASEMVVPSTILSSPPKGRMGGLGEESPMESGVVAASGWGTDGLGRIPELQDGAAVISGRGGIARGTAENAVVEEKTNLWDAGGGIGAVAIDSVGRSAPSAAALPGLNRGSPAGTPSLYTNKGSSQSGDGGPTRLFVGNLHWWTTDAELEAALSEYGRVKNLKFFEERASGKSKGYCEVEFYDSAAARACKDGMNGKVFNGKACVVTFASAYTLKQMSAAYTGNAQPQQPPLPPVQGRRAMGDGGGMRGGGMSSQSGKMGSGYRGQGPGSANRMGQGNSGRGRGMRTRGLGVGSAGTGVSTYGQGNPGPMPGPRIRPQGMMSQGYDPSYGSSLARGGSGYGGFVPRGPPYAGMGLPYPTMVAGGLPGVAPHVNPAFFGRGATVNGMGMMAGSMEGTGGWADPSMGGWGGEEHDRRIREDSYGEESGGMDYSYDRDVGRERGRAGSGRDRGTEGDWMPSGERRYREDKDVDWEREKFGERERELIERERFWEDEDFERDRYSRTRNKSRGVIEEQRTRSRDEDYGKRRRMVSE